MWNGYGEQMSTVCLPRISGDHRLLKAPHWSRLGACHRLGSQCLGQAIPDDVEEIAHRPFPERA